MADADGMVRIVPSDREARETLRAVVAQRAASSSTSSSPTNGRRRRSPAWSRPSSTRTTRTARSTTSTLADADHLAHAALAHWQLGARRAPATPIVRVHTPTVASEGWDAPHTMIDIVNDDMPFLVDSVTMAIDRHDLGIHLVVHPVLDVQRADDGALVALGPGARDRRRESWVHVEVDRETSADDPRRGARRPRARARRRARRDRRLAEDARRRRRGRRRARRQPAADRSRRARRGPGAACGGWPISTSRSSATASTTSSATPTAATCLRAVPGSGLGILRPRQPARDRHRGRSRVGQLLAAPGRDPRQGARADAARAHEGQRALDRAPPDLPRLRRREALRRRRQRDRRAPLPRPLHVVGLHREPDRHSGAAPQGLRRDRALAVRAREPRLQGSDRDPRELPARRPLPDRRVDALRHRDRDPRPAGAAARAHVRAPRAVRPLRLVPRVRAPRSLQHAGSHPHRRRADRRVRRVELRVERAPVGVGARPPALRAARRSRPIRSTRSVDVPRTWRRASPPRRGRGPTTCATRSWPRTARKTASTCCDRGAPRSRPSYQEDFPAADAVADLAVLAALDADGAPPLAVRLEGARRPPRPRALRPRRAAVALRGAAAPHEHGRDRRRRASVHDHAGRPAGPLDQALPAARPGDARRPARTTSSKTRSSRSRPATPKTTCSTSSCCSPVLSWREVVAAPRVQPLPAPGRHAVQPDLRRDHARRAPRDRAPADRSCSRARFDPAHQRDRRRHRRRSSAEITEELDAVASLDEDRILRALLHLVLATLRTNWFQTDDQRSARARASC